MPMFYFHSQTDSRYTDSDGVEFSGAVEARREAIRTCGEMMRDCADSFWGSRPWSVSVTDADGLILWELSVDGYQSTAGSQTAP